MKIRLFSILLLLFSKLCFAENQSNQSPFNDNLQDLSITVSDIVTEINPSLGQGLENDIIDLASVVNSNTCETQLGIISSDPSHITFPSYNIPGAAYNLQIADLLRDATELDRFRDEIYPFFNLVATYARENGLQNLDAVTSTDLAQRLSEFAASRYNLHFPKGILLVEVISLRIARDPANLGRAFGGVSELSLTEKTEILHHIINRIDNDPNAQGSELDRFNRSAAYFRSAGLSEGIIINENHLGQNRYTLLVKDESGSFIRHSYSPTARTIEPRQRFSRLDGSEINAEDVPSEYRGIVAAQLMSERPPTAWSRPNIQNPDENPITLQTPNIVIEPAPTPQVNGQEGVIPVYIQGLNQETPPATARVEGQGGITYRTGSLPSAQTYSQAEINELDTNISTIELPNFRNPRADEKKEITNILGLTNRDAPNGEIFEASIATVGATDGVVLRTIGSSNDGVTTRGFSTLYQESGDQDILEGSAFIQQGDDFGLSGRYRTDQNGTLIEGRSFLTLDTTDRTDPDNIVRGVSVTAITNFRSQTTETGNVTQLDTTLSTDIPVGEDDTIRTMVNIDSDTGFNGAAALYETNLSEDVDLSLAGEVGQNGRSLSARVETEDTIVALRNEENNQGQIQNTITLGRDLDFILPENVEGYVVAERSQGDIENRSTISTAFNINPGIILSDDGRVIISSVDSSRENPNGGLIENQSNRSFTVMDTIGTMTNFDLSYTTSNTETPNTVTNRDIVAGRLTYGVDREGQPIEREQSPFAAQRGVRGSLGAQYTSEDSTTSAVGKGNTTPGATTREEFRVNADIGYTEVNRLRNTSLSLSGGTEYIYEVVRNGGTLVSETEQNGFRIASEYTRGLQRRQATCSASQRTMVNATGVSRENPWECRITFSQRF